MFIPSAYAQTPGASAADPFGGLIMILPMFVILYFLVMRPQMKRAKEQKQLLEQLQKGDEVVTAGGMVGKLTKIGESYVTVEIAREGGNAIEVNMQKGAISTVLPKGTIKAL